MFTSHEGLLLCYEASMTRLAQGRHFNLSTHMLWLGERTRKLGSAHIEYFRGIENPIGMKIGPGADLTELGAILQQLNPQNEVGKLVLILRLGVKQMRAKLPAIIAAVQASGVAHIWEVDPMHGNTFKTEDGIKTRRYEDLLEEIVTVGEMLAASGEILAGMHLETASEDVTECLGGAVDVKEKELCLRYTTLCDPRLNLAQTRQLLETVGHSMRVHNPL